LRQNRRGRQNEKNTQSPFHNVLAIERM